MDKEDKFRKEMLEALEQAHSEYVALLKDFDEVHKRFHDRTEHLRDVNELLEYDKDKVPDELLEATLIPCLIDHIIMPKINMLISGLLVGVLVTKNYEMVQGLRPFDPKITMALLDALKGKFEASEIKDEDEDPFGDLSNVDFDSLGRGRDCRKRKNDDN